MTPDAVVSLELGLVRREVPEFERVFQGELREEDGQLGAFQAFSLLADWVRDRLEDGTDEDAVMRTFAAIERLVTDEGFPLGDALAAEFIEAIWDHPSANERMGPTTRERARPSV